MDYIYDILLNFNKSYFEFFEWKNSDNVINIKKIPCYRVDDELYLKLKYNDVVVGENFISLIKNKTYLYGNNKKDTIMCLFTNGKDVFGASFSGAGKLIKRSSLIIDEAEEVLEEACRCETIKINIIKEYKREVIIVGRREREKKHLLKEYLNNDNINDICLKYMYYDYFEIEEDNLGKIKNKLLMEINNSWNYKLDNLYKLVMVLEKIKN